MEEIQEQDIQQAQEEPVAETGTIEPETEPGSLEEALAALELMRKRLQEVNAEREQLNDQVLRLQADFINFRKRKEREMSDTIMYANQELVQHLLPILDNWDRTLDAIEKTDNLTAIKEGIALVENAMKRQLSKIGVSPVESIGQPFNSELHEVVTTVDMGEEKRDLIIDEAEKGYKLRDKVIRFAKVIVGE
ncbi:MAG: nucleotide exchange factor GrpE [Bacteroidetes bacterium]|jgi:molecular chaperone GrpE|nr:MAG: nucleotide exchange factor GrpE [Bacteroidota bacterium]